MAPAAGGDRAGRGQASAPLGPARPSPRASARPAAGGSPAGRAGASSAPPRARRSSAGPPDWNAWTNRVIWGWEERRAPSDGRPRSWPARARSLRAAPTSEARVAGSDDRPDDRAPAPARAAPDFGGLSDPFVVRLMQLLRDQEGASDAFDHLEAELAAQGTDPNEVLRREHHCPGRQPGDRRQLRAQPPLALGHGLERLLRAEQPRRGDPRRGPLRRSTRSRTSPPATDTGGSSRRSPGARAPTRSRSPAAPSSWPAAAAGPSLDPGDGEPRDHVGYYLVDRGRPELEAAFGYGPRWRERLFAGCWAIRARPTSARSRRLLVAILALAVRRGPGLRRPARGGSSPAVAALLLPLSELAVGLVNHLLTLLLPPRVLPKLAFKEGIPAEHATIIVIPGMLVAPPAPGAGRAAGDPLPGQPRPEPPLRPADRLRRRPAARPCPRTTSCPRRPGAHPRLNDRYRGLERPARGRRQDQRRRRRPTRPGPDRFFLFHRRRLWNASQGCWMGWERKRGKLLEFNRLLRGARDTSYSVCERRAVEPAEDPVRHHAGRGHPDAARHGRPPGRLAGPPAEPAAVRPGPGPGGRRLRRAPAEDQLPPDGRHALAVRRDAGDLRRHRPVFDGGLRRLHGPLRRRHASPARGSTTSTPSRRPPARPSPRTAILSHDLIEGNYARCGLLSDTELFDDFPARVQRLRAPRAPLGPRRLAAPAWLGGVPEAGRGREGDRRARDLRTLLGPTDRPGWHRRPATPSAHPRAMEAAGQPPPQPGPARAARCSWCWAGRSCPARRGPGRRWPWPSSCCPDPVVAVDRDREHPLPVAARPEEVARDPAGDVRPDRHGDRLPGLSVLAAARRDRAHAGAAVREPPQAAGVGDGRVDRAAAGDRPGHFIRGCGRGRPGDRDRAVLVGLVRPERDVAACSVPGGLADVPVVAYFLSRPGAVAHHHPDRRRAPGLAAGRAQDLAVLRDVRRRRRPLAPARQLPGGPRRPHRPPDLADQQGPAAALDPLRQRPGLHRPAADGRAAGEDVRGARPRWRSTGATSTTGTRRETLQPLPPKYISTVDSGNLLGCLHRAWRTA